MRKVMLVIDEFSEMVGLESFLRRLGFDVLSLGKEMLVTDALLSFQPEVVIASFKGRNVDGLRLALRLKKTMIPPPRVALAYSGPRPQIPQESQRLVEALIEIPVEPQSVIQMLSKLSGLPAEPLLEKYAKVSAAVLTRDEKAVLITDQAAKAAKAASPGMVSGGVSTKEWDPQTMRGQAANVRTERSNRYDAYLETHSEEKVEKVLPHDKAAKAMAKLKKDSEAEKDTLDQIHAEKQAFAKALFEAGKDEKSKK